MRNTIWIACLLLCACDGEEASRSTQDVIAQKTTGPVVFIGDSITQHFPTADYLPGSINVGIHSQTSSMMLARFAADVLQKQPRVVVILAGTNDILRSSNPSVHNIADMADAARASGAAVILGTLPPNEEYIVGDFVTREEGYAAFSRFNADLKLLAATYRYGLADYDAAMRLPDGKQNADLFIHDHQHPSKAGYDVMWAVVGPLITPPLP